MRTTINAAIAPALSGITTSLTLRPSDSHRGRILQKFLSTCPGSLLECPLTTIQFYVGWGSSTASIAKPVTIVYSGSAPSDFAFNLVDNLDFRNRNHV